MWRGGRGGLDHAVMIERIGGDPARHEDHGHAGSGMGGAAGEVEAGDVGAAVGRLEGAVQPAVAGQAVDGAVEDAVAAVDVVGGEPAFELDPALEVGEPGGPFELLEDAGPV